MELSTSAELSEILGISPKRISILCASGRVDGVMKKGKMWLIPAGAKKPEDPRKLRKVERFAGKREEIGC